MEGSIVPRPNRKPPVRDGKEITYYDQPSLKPAPWDWKVPLYTFLAPVAGAAQLLATVTALTRPRTGANVVRDGRYAALIGAAIGGPLLIGDLHTPKRWYNMLRIFRSTSPMSIGSWLLMAFGGSSAVVALAQAGMDRHIAKPLARGFAGLAQIPAALTGAGMAMYSASLFTATSSPLWAAAPRSLSMKFGSSAVAAAAAGLSLADQLRGRGNETTAPLDHIAAAATLVNLAATVSVDQVYRGAELDHTLDEPDIAAGYKLGSIVVGQILPLTCYAINAARARPHPGLSLIASVAVIGGSYLMRLSLIEAGKRSSRSPRDAFRFARRRQRRQRSGLRRS